MVKTLYANNSDKLPVILSSQTINLIQNKFLVPDDINIARFLINIRKHITASPEVSNQTAYYLITSGNTPISPVEEMSSVYSKHKEACGFLYLCIEKEDMYG